jgi:hypothetical protein
MAGVFFNVAAEGEEGICQRVVSICSRCIFHCTAVTSYLRSCTASFRQLYQRHQEAEEFFLWQFCHLLVRNSRGECSILWWKSRNYFEGITSDFGTLIVSLRRMFDTCHPFDDYLSTNVTIWRIIRLVRFYESLEYDVNNRIMLFSNKVTDILTLS